jgi:hypothetical protein
MKNSKDGIMKGPQILKLGGMGNYPRGLCRDGESHECPITSYFEKRQHCMPDLLMMSQSATAHGLLVVGKSSLLCGCIRVTLAKGCLLPSLRVKLSAQLLLHSALPATGDALTQ